MSLHQMAEWSWLGWDTVRGQSMKCHVSRLSSTHASSPGGWGLCSPAFPGLAPPLLPPHQLLQSLQKPKPFFWAFYPLDYKPVSYHVTTYTIYYASVTCQTLGYSHTSFILPQSISGTLVDPPPARPQ